MKLIIANCFNSTFFILLIFAAVILTDTVLAQRQPKTEEMSPSELFLYRENYLKDFTRIGINTTRGDAVFLRIIIRSMNAKRGVEIGSANGYGAIHMGMGFEATGGHLYTIEINTDMARQCRENINKTGLEKTVSCIEGDALKEIPKLKGEFDFVFIDAVKRDYFKYFKAISPKLKSGAVIVADNVISFANAMKGFLEAMEENPDYDMVIIRASMEKRDGMAVIYKRK